MTNRFLTRLRNFAGLAEKPERPVYRLNAAKKSRGRPPKNVGVAGNANMNTGSAIFLKAIAAVGLRLDADPAEIIAAVRYYKSHKRTMQKYRAKMRKRRAKGKA